MIAVDTNPLVNAHREDSRWHAEANRVIANLADGQASWAIPWPCTHEFLSTITHPRVYKLPTPSADALGQIAAWLESPSLVLLAEGSGYFAQLGELLEASRAVGPQIHDARIAALGRHHGMRELWTADWNFGRFAGLATRNSLTGSSWLAGMPVRKGERLEV